MQISKTHTQSYTHNNNITHTATFVVAGGGIWWQKSSIRPTATMVVPIVFRPAQKLIHTSTCTKPHTHVQKHPLQLFIDLEGGWRQLVAGSSENKEKRTTSTERGDEEISGIKGSVRHDGEAAVRSSVLVFNCGGRTSTRNDHNGYLPGSPIDLHYLRPLQTSMAVLVGRKSKRIWWEELLNQNTASDDRKKRRIDM